MRDAPRLFLPDDLAEGAAIALDRDRAHYLRHVLRLSAADPVRVFNPHSGEWQARLTADGGGKSATLLVEHRLRPPLPAGRAIDPAGRVASAAGRVASPAGRVEGPALIFAALKRDATDLVVRMAVELGAGALHPIATERTVASRVNLERLGAIAREAAEQCERLDVPTVAPLVSLYACLDAWPRAEAIAAAIERAPDAPRLGRRALHSPGPGRPEAALLVGPEGGFSRGELDVLARHPFVHPVSLGPLVLRAETACAVGLALLQAERWDVEPG